MSSNIIYVVPSGFVHEDLIQRSQDESDEIFKVQDNTGNLGTAWRTDSNLPNGTYLFSPYDIPARYADKVKLDKFKYIERKLKSEIRRIDEEIREGTEQISP
jgi:hypothetical protein